jgi:hypothetical protein
VLLCSTSHVEGDILHEGLVLEAGAFFDGNSIPPDDLLADAPKNGSEVNRTIMRTIRRPGALKSRQDKDTALRAPHLISSVARELFSSLGSHTLSKYLILLLLLAGAVFAIANDNLRLSGAEEAATDSTTRIIAVYDFLSTAPPGYEKKVQAHIRQLRARGDSFIRTTSRLFEVSATWIYARMPTKDVGRTMPGEIHPIARPIGRIGVIQLAPAGHEKMREQGPGVDLHVSHDHAITGTTDLRSSPNLDNKIQESPTLPANPHTDLISTGGVLDAGAPRSTRPSAPLAEFTRPDGSPVWIDVAMVKSIRATFPGEYPSSVQSVVSWGTSKQGVRETVAEATALIRDHGGRH